MTYFVKADNISFLKNNTKISKIMKIYTFISININIVLRTPGIFIDWNNLCMNDTDVDGIM